jgi:hypothetical protein
VINSNIQKIIPGKEGVDKSDGSDLFVEKDPIGPELVVKIRRIYV